MGMPLHCPWCCHVSTMALSWRCHGIILWQCLVDAMAEQWQCMAMPWRAHSNAIGVPCGNMAPPLHYIGMARWGVKFSGLFFQAVYNLVGLESQFLDSPGQFGNAYCKDFAASSAEPSVLVKFGLTTCQAKLWLSLAWLWLNSACV